MNVRIRRVAFAVALFFLALVGQLTFLQIVDAKKLVSNENNGRTLAEERRFQRGTIFSADGKVLAESEEKDGEFTRRYPLGSLFGGITGFSSAKYGRSGIEFAANEHLMAQQSATTFREYVNQLTGGKPAGNDIYLTISERLQRAATQALGDRRGAVVVLDPRTGDVLALVSNPTYDPNRIDESFQAIKSDPAAPLVNRATQGLYPPGSTFKIITSATALEKGKATAESSYDGPAQLSVYGGKVTNFESEEMGAMTLEDAFAHSVNTVFAKVGLDVGPDLVDYAKRFGFDAKPPIDLPASTSRIPEASEMDKLALAWTAVGQAQLEASPLQMALVASGIANDGTIMAPRLIKEIRNPGGSLLDRPATSAWKQAVSKETAKTISSMMFKTVEAGTGRAARIEGVKVAGKTGTAETESGAPDAWFVGFVPVDEPKVAVAVIIEEGGTGGAVAAPIAQEVIAAALGK